MRFTETRIVYENDCWYIPQYRQWGIWWNYETQKPGSDIALKAQFFTLKQAQEFIDNCKIYNTYKGPK